MSSTTATMSPNTTTTSASTPKELPYQRTLYIREIEATPISLMKFPLTIIEPDYEVPGKETTEEVHTLERLNKLLEKYYAFKANTLYTKQGWLFRAVEQPQCPWMVETGMPMASDNWAVPEPPEAAAWAAANGDEPCVLPSIRVRFPGLFDSKKVDYFNSESWLLQLRKQGVKRPAFE